MRNFLYLIIIIWALPFLEAHAISTFRIKWEGDKVAFSSLKTKDIAYKCGKSSGDIRLMVNQEKPIRIILSGETLNGSLHLESNTECTLVFNNLRLTSINGPAIEIPTSSKVTIELPEDSYSVLCDSSSYKKKESKSLSRACLAFAGPLYVRGGGNLQVVANKRHGIKCDNSIIVDDGNLTIQIAHQGAKGIDSREFIMNAGTINGFATSDVVYKDSIFTYSSLLKSDGNMTINGGKILLNHQGKGNRGISCGENFVVKGGELQIISSGDGGYVGDPIPGKFYWDVHDYRQFYSPHCISANNCFFERGYVDCQISGLGGKGIVASNILTTGVPNDSISGNGPQIKVVTTGDCINNDFKNDKRDGCPKGIRSRIAKLYGGSIDVVTEKPGGEGVESDSLSIWNTTLICNTFDDGINAKKDISVYGGQIYCNSVDNDGIDSNGSMSIYGGVIASISQNKQNESFDAEKRDIHIYGGIIFGIGNSQVKLQSTEIPLYNSSASQSLGRRKIPALTLHKGEYIYFLQQDTVIMAIRNTNETSRGSVMATSPSLVVGQQYTLSSSSLPPKEFKQELFNGRLFIAGKKPEAEMQVIEEFTATKWNNI